MKVLHITNWYPNDYNRNEAIWIKRHIQSLPKEVESKILHFEIFPKNGFSLRSFRKENLNATLLTLPFENWFTFEIIHFVWLFIQLILLKKHRNFDIINFHIAYPMLTYWHWIKRFVKIPIVITEHWSAYHFNFGVKKKLTRIERIFLQKIPVIAVSESLVRDIKSFSKGNFDYYILPNVIDEDLFSYDSSVHRGNYLFMVSQWKYPKDPFKIMMNFLESKFDEGITLIVGGYGPQWESMVDFVQQNDSKQLIKLVGKLTTEEVAFYMKRCRTFVHMSKYETFSVVCAEALSCGTPVLASNVGGIREYVDDRNGVLIDNSDDLKNVLEKILDKKFQHDSISRLISEKFSKRRVGTRYYKYLETICNNWNK